MTDTHLTTVAPRELRCFACCLGNHNRCHGDPCGCTRHWPVHADVDPLNGPVPPRRAVSDSA